MHVCRPTSLGRCTRPQARARTSLPAATHPCPSLSPLPTSATPLGTRATTTTTTRTTHQLIAYAEENGIPVPSSKRGEPPFSMDANLLHISYEGNALENPWTQPDESMFTRSVSPEEVRARRCGAWRVARGPQHTLCTDLLQGTTRAPACDADTAVAACPRAHAVSPRRRRPTSPRTLRLSLRRATPSSWTARRSAPQPCSPR
jgi:hypothetical protein